jgi:hypothetical protein
MITACIVLLYLSYSIPVICLLVRGRGNIKHGPFWLGSIGFFSNIVLLLWTLFTLVMYSFPYAKPVAASNMNCKCTCHSLLEMEFELMVEQMYASSTPSLHPSLALTTCFGGARALGVWMRGRRTLTRMGSALWMCRDMGGLGEVVLFRLPLG